MFSEGVERALHVAVHAHSGQSRKGSGDVPYVVHPIHVALLVRAFHDDEVLVQAALLHDVVEDCDDWTHERIEEAFGQRVAAIVAELSEDKTQDWSTRKRAGIARVSELSDGAAVVQACDKLHNMRSLAVDLRLAPDPELVWGTFRGGRAGTLEVSRAMAEALATRVSGHLAAALRDALAALEAAS